MRRRPIPSTMGHCVISTSLEPIRTIIATIRRRLPPPAPIAVVHTDLPENDFNALLALLGDSPESYLRDVLCLLPSWPKSRVLELAPCNWQQTRQQPDAQQRLAANVFRNAVLELDLVHSSAT